MPLAIMPTTSPTGVGANLLDLCRRVADTVGFRIETSTSAEATVGEASRIILANELRDDESGYEVAARDWVYVPQGLTQGAQAGTQRRILEQPGVGYQGPRGAVILSRPLDAALEAGITVDFTSPQPMRRHLGIDGYREGVNQGLACIWVPARLTATGTGSYEHDLATYSTYLDRPDFQIRTVSDTQDAGSSYPAEASPYDHRVVANGVTRSLVTDNVYASGETFYLDVIVKADRLIFDGSSWGYTTQAQAGLRNDNHQTAAPADWAYVFGCWKAYQNWGKMVAASKTMSTDEKAAIMGGPTGVTAKRRQYATAAFLIQQEQFPKPTQERTQPMMVGAAPDDEWQ